MKIWISYFYQVRRFPTNLIPFSTAQYDPKWFHKFEGQNKVFIDERGVINGLRLPELCFPKDAYEYLIEKDSACSKDCPRKSKVEYQLKQNQIKNDWTTFGCEFMDRYFEHLWNNVDFDKLISFLEKVKLKYQELNKTDEDIEFVLLVHEPPSNPCSERWVLKRWFEEFDYNLEEWFPYEE